MELQANKPLRVGLVGCGAHTYAHGEAAQGLNDLRFAACCDVHLEAAKRWADTFGLSRAYCSFDEMWDGGDLDAIVLCTWPNLHHDQILSAIRRGCRNILCEKALCLTSDEAASIYLAAKETGARLLEGFMWRHHPSVRRAKDIAEQGAIGTLDNIRAEFSWLDPPPATPPHPEARGWRQRPECGGGVVYDALCYAVDACGWFAASQPVRVHATGATNPHYGTIHRVFGHIEYANGVVGAVASSSGAQF